MNSGFADRRKEVDSALLDYHQSPGKYPVLLRRPAVLFSSLREVLQLASGRLPDGAAAPSPAVQRAAGFFVRSALLHPGADHYTLLGLERSADAAAIKERYRQMMRLMHPDFATAVGGGSWPADAASRINQAYEVLASSVQRAAYDATLDSAVGAAPVQRSERSGVAGSAHLRAAAASAPAEDPRARLKRIAGVFGGLGAVALGASLLAGGPSAESLVQRAAPREMPPVAPAVTADTKPMVPPVEPSLEQLALAPVRPSDTELQPVPNILAGALVPPAISGSHRAAAPPAETPPWIPPARPAMSRAATAVSGNSAQPFAAVLPATKPAAPQEPAVGQPFQPVQISQASPASQAPQPAPAAQPLHSPPSPQTTQAPQPPVPVAAAAPAKPPPASAVSLADAHTLLSKLLQQMEAGSGERLLAGLDRSVRNAAGAQALLRQYNALVDGARTVKVANLQLKAEPRDDRLLVTGYVALEIGEYSAVRSKELPLQAEFARRGGTVVMTQLAPGPGFAEADRKAD